MDTTLGRLTLNRFNGREVFAVSSATIYMFSHERGVDLNFEIETSAALETCPDTAELSAQPNAEFTVRVAEHSWTNFVGRSFQIPSGDDPQSDDEVTRLYNFQHETTDDKLIDVLGQRAGRYLVRIQGICPDVNYYDGSRARTDFQIEAWFAPPTAT